MDEIAGMRTTGRNLRGPASDLIELDGANGLRHSAIVFHPRYVEHSAINDALTVVRDYLSSPMVTGMIELGDVDPQAGAYVYPTGQCWSVAEAIRLLADMGESGGVRAGLELMFACGQILVEAADTGEAEGVYSHGGLTPWRVMLRKDGQVMVIGYALPQVEILEFHADPEQVPREDSFRYCPPERMEAAAEDISSDLFGLTLIAFELITGKPVYDGLVDDIRQQAARGEGSRRLFRFRDALTPAVRELLGRALKPAFEHRYPSGDDYLDAVRAALRAPDVTGPSLLDLMARVAGHTQRAGARPESASTMMGTAEDFRKLLDDEDDEPVEDGPQRAAWAPPPRRPGRRAAPRSGEPAPAPSAEPAPAAEPEPAPAPGRRAARKPRRATRSGGEGDAELMASLRRSRMSGDGPAPKVASSRVSSVGRTARRSERGGGDAPPPARGDEPREAAAAAPAPEPRLDATDLERRIRMSGGGAPAPEPPARPARRASPRRAPRSGSLPVTTGPARGALPITDEEAEVSLSLPLPEVGSAPLRGRVPKARPAPVAKPAPKPAPKPKTKPAGKPKAKPAGKPKAKPAAEPKAATKPKAKPKGKAAANAKAPAKQDAKVKAPRQAASSKPAAAPEPVAVPAVASPGLPEAAGAVPGAVRFIAAASLGRAPDPIVGGTKGARTQKLALRRGPKSALLRLKVAGAQPLGEVLANLVGTVLPVRADLTGRVSGWYRLRSGDTRLPAAMLAKDAPEGELLIEHVPNSLVHADVHVEGASGPVRFVSPIGTAVPVLSLVDHLCAWLDLPAGAWQLHHGEQALASYLILDDLSPAADALLTLRLVRANP